MKFDVLVELILEKTKWNSQPILSRLKPYSSDASYFVTFTNIEKVGINPKNAFSTPIGVYAYSLKDLWNDWMHGDDFFGKDRPYINLLKLNTDKVLNLNTYRFNNKDLNILKKEYNSVNKLSTDFNAFIKQSQKEVSSDTNLYQNDTQGAILWHMTEKISHMLAPGDNKAFTVRWNKLFRELGYDVVVDRGSIIHVLQSSQAVFLTPTSYSVVERLVNKQQSAALMDYWGSIDQPFWRPGPNPTVDMVLKYVDKSGIRILLIKRNSASATEANKWALPGGFIDTNAQKGEAFKWGRETPKQAAVRELTEETRLYIGNIKDIGGRIKDVGVFKGNNRDPRDNKEAWSQSHAFTLTITPQDGIDIDSVQGQDDASDARWFNVNDLPVLAFDHAKIINMAVRIK